MHAATFNDYLQLCKPKIVLLLLLTAFAGMLLASTGQPPLPALLGGLLGIGLCASSSAVINHLLERDSDLKMARTHDRPLPGGRVSPTGAWILAASLASLGTALLLWLTNPICALLTLLALIGYAAIYTAVLKPATPYNIVIGGLPGAAPPLLGWTAISGDVQPAALLLVAVVFVWTPAHFWALALNRLDDYRKAGVPMLPVTHGEAFTRLQIVLYTLLTLATSLLLFAVGAAGVLYFAAALLLGVFFVAHAFWLLIRPTPERALHLFHSSNIYLLLLFAAITADHLLAPMSSPSPVSEQSLQLQQLLP